MFRKLIETGNSYSALVLRLALGIVMFPHGAQKLHGWFGGAGFSATMEAFAQRYHIPAVFALLDIIAESFGALGLLVGLLTRVAAFGIACVMVVATLLAHLPHGFFMNWGSRKAGEGFEYHILAFGIAVALIIVGGGALSLDRLITRKKSQE